jgi:Carboxylesterase type B
MEIDVRHLLRIPEDFEIAPELEDEFECLNLEITCPPVSFKEPLPVLVWIHGLFLLLSKCINSNSSQVAHRLSPFALRHPRFAVSINSTL